MPDGLEEDIAADIGKDKASFVDSKHTSFSAVQAGEKSQVAGIKRTKIELAVNVYWDTFDKNNLGAVTKK